MPDIVGLLSVCRGGDTSSDARQSGRYNSRLDTPARRYNLEFMSDAVIVPPGDVEVDDLDEVHEVLPTKFSITSFGADFLVDGVVKRLNAGDIVIPSYKKPSAEGQSTVGFQRDFVWDKWQSDRFVESLLLGLPVPGIFLVKEPNEKHLVLDGKVGPQPT